MWKISSGCFQRCRIENINLTQDQNSTFLIFVGRWMSSLTTVHLHTHSVFIYTHAATPTLKLHTVHPYDRQQVGSNIYALYYNIIRVLQFVPLHLVRKLLQSSSNPPSKSRDHELMKPQIRRARCVCLSVSFSLFLLQFPYECQQQSLLSYTCFDSFLGGCLMLLSVVRMVGQTLLLKRTLINLHDLEFSAQCSVTPYLVSFIQPVQVFLFQTVSTLMGIDLEIVF